ncbi:hypothetical protein [Streptomyces sp. NPDC058755]|uniref:hypothetical protein n=1 Tax=Streptomyces sp. NPDC058755 TaxID=3346624 RepID=UPI003676078A
MSTELLVASLSGAVALVSVLISTRGARKQALLTAELEQRDVMARHRDPLLWAAFDLQSRLFNIVDRRFLLAYYANGSERKRAYASRSTLHVLAEYLGQVELLRRRIQFLDLGNRHVNRTIVGHLMTISNVLNDDAVSRSWHPSL